MSDIEELVTSAVGTLLAQHPIEQETQGHVVSEVRSRCVGCGWTSPWVLSWDDAYGDWRHHLVEMARRR